MKKGMLLVLLACGALSAGAQTFDIPEKGKLSLFVDPTEWNVNSQVTGSLTDIMLSPKRGTNNASAAISIVVQTTDPWGTKAKLKEEVTNRFDDMVDESVEGKVVARELSMKDAFGYFAQFTDKSLVGKPVQKGTYKVMAEGVARLAPNVYAHFKVFADSFKDENYISLLATAEGMVFEPLSNEPTAPSRPVPIPKAPAARDAAPDQARPTPAPVAPIRFTAARVESP